MCTHAQWPAQEHWTLLCSAVTVGLAYAIQIHVRKYMGNSVIQIQARQWERRKDREKGMNQSGRAKLSCLNALGHWWSCVSTNTAARCMILTRQMKLWAEKCGGDNLLETSCPEHKTSVSVFCAPTSKTVDSGSHLQDSALPCTNRRVRYGKGCNWLSGFLSDPIQLM
jgi:hypothetical protein